MFNEILNFAANHQTELNVFVYTMLALPVVIGVAKFVSDMKHCKQ